MTMTLSKVSCMSPCVALTCAFAIDVLLQKGEGNNGQCLRLELWNEPSHIILVRCCLARSLTHSLTLCPTNSLAMAMQRKLHWHPGNLKTRTNRDTLTWRMKCDANPCLIGSMWCYWIGLDGMESSNINWILIYAYTEWWVRTKGMLMTNGNPASGRCMFSCQVTEWRQLLFLLSAMVLQAVVSVVASLVTYFDISF